MESVNGILLSDPPEDGALSGEAALQVPLGLPQLVLHLPLPLLPQGQGRNKQI